MTSTFAGLVLWKTKKTFLCLFWPNSALSSLKMEKNRICIPIKIQIFSTRLTGVYNHLLCISKQLSYFSFGPNQSHQQKRNLNPVLLAKITRHPIRPYLSRSSQYWSSMVCPLSMCVVFTYKASQLGLLTVVSSSLFPPPSPDDSSSPLYYLLICKYSKQYPIRNVIYIRGRTFASLLSLGPRGRQTGMAISETDSHFYWRI